VRPVEGEEGRLTVASRSGECRSPPYMSRELAQSGTSIDSDSRGFVFQSDAVSVMRFLEMGTRSSTVADELPQSAPGPPKLLV
jgi:hypothetical protein